MGLFLARDTGRLLIAQRSRHVSDPSSWGTFGGPIDPDLSPIERLRKEVREECGFSGSIRVSPMLVFVTESDFRYFFYLVTVDSEFDPKLKRANQGFLWVEFGRWPTPMHFCLKALLADASSIETMRRAVSVCKGLTEKRLTASIPQVVVAPTQPDAAMIAERQKGDRRRSGRARRGYNRRTAGDRRAGVKPLGGALDSDI